MKTTFTRLLALLLALAMVLTVCGCSQSGKKKPTGEITEQDGEVPEDLGGYEFTVVDCNNGRWNKEKSGTPYADAWLQIMDEVESLYNCTISASYIGSTEMFTTLQPEFAAGGKYADLILTTQWQYGYFLGAELMMDLNRLEVNWDHEWWNQDVRQMGTYGGKSYAGLGSFNFDTNNTWLLYYNEAIWDEMGYENPYKLVDEHRWTYDLFRDYCQRATLDQDNSGDLDSVDDRWGVLAADGDFARAWFFSLGGEYFKTDDKGRVSLACNTKKTYDIIDKMRVMTKQDKSVCTVGVSGGGNMADHVARFLNGTTLFLAITPGVAGLQDMEDDWGVIPLPLYDENQADYLSGVDHNSTVFGVSNNNEDIHEVSVLLEALGRHAMILEDIFWPDYKETYWRHEEEDTRMVSQYVVGHGKHDLALIMQNCNNIFSAPMSRVYSILYGSGSADFASWVESIEGIVDTALEDYFKYDEDEAPVDEEPADEEAAA